MNKSQDTGSTIISVVLIFSGFCFLVSGFARFSSGSIGSAVAYLLLGLAIISFAVYYKKNGLNLTRRR